MGTNYVKLYNLVALFLVQYIRPPVLIQVETQEDLTIEKSGTSARQTIFFPKNQPFLLTTNIFLQPNGNGALHPRAPWIRHFILPPVVD